MIHLLVSSVDALYPGTSLVKREKLFRIFASLEPPYQTRRGVPAALLLPVSGGMGAEARGAQGPALFGGPRFDQVGCADVAFGYFLTDLWMSTESSRGGDTARKFGERTRTADLISLRVSYSIAEDTAP